MSSSQEDPDQAGFGQITADLRDLLKVTRRITRDDADHIVHQVEGELDPAEEDREDFTELYLTEAAEQTLFSLAGSLASNLSFEHLSRDQIKRELEAFVGRDQRSPPSNPDQAAREFIRMTARHPEEGIFYFGVRHLSGLEAPLDVSQAVFLPAADVAFLRPALSDDVFQECDIYSRVASVAGNTDRLVERAQRAAMSALSLLRLHLQQVLQVATAEELLFDLHPVYARELGDNYYLGYRRGFAPSAFGLQGLTPDLLAPLAVEGQLISSLPAPFRERVDTALEWLDIAARSSTWKTKLLTIFGAIESLLVPEVGGNKAEVVTVRAAIVEAATNGGTFTHPDQTLKAYLLRCDLTHGSPTGHGPLSVEYEGRAIRIDDPDDLAGRCYWWAKDVLSAYLSHIKEYLAGGGRAKPKSLVSDLDRSEAAEEVCNWFLQSGASDLVDKYRDAVGLSRLAREDA